MQPASDIVGTAIARHRREDLAWFRLLLAVISTLTESGLPSRAALMILPDAGFVELTLSGTLLRACRGALAALRSTPFDEALFLQHVLKLPRQDSSLTVHAALGPSGSASPAAGPPPSATLSALCMAADGGVAIGPILDNLADHRAGCGISAGTASTYASHFKQIRFARFLFDVSAHCLHLWKHFAVCQA